MKVNETKELNLKFPENYTEELKNKDVLFKVKVNEIKERVLPELSKEFYEDLGYKDVDDEKGFRNKVKEEILKRKEASAEDKYISDCLDKAVSNMKVDINDEIIHEEIHHMMHQFEDQIKMQGITLEQYISFSGLTMDKFEDQLKPEATNRVKSHEKKLKSKFATKYQDRVKSIQNTDTQTIENRKIAEEIAKMESKLTRKPKIISSIKNNDKYN